MAKAGQDILDSIRLARSDGIGAKTFRQLMERFKTPGEALRQAPDILKQGRRVVSILPLAEAEKEYTAAERLGLRYVLWSDPHYPVPLKAIEDAPPLLVVKGDPAVLQTPMIAIVGARNASLNGRKFARMLGSDLSKAGLTIISGMARGIDGAAHEGVLAAGGRTVAVLAGGTDIIYPPEHREIYARIAETGAVISEMPPGTEPQAALFPRRNRIISGASLGVVVVEATPRSGSLITARLAADQGRDVFAVPGSPLDPRAHGPNGLIRDGAILIQSKDDILYHIPSLDVSAAKISRPRTEAAQTIEIQEEGNLTDVQRRIEMALSTAPAAVDELVRQCQVSAAVMATALLELELAGRLERLPGNRVALIGTV